RRSLRRHGLRLLARCSRLALSGCGASRNIPLPPKSSLFPYTTLFRSLQIARRARRRARNCSSSRAIRRAVRPSRRAIAPRKRCRSEEHTSELQSRENLVCRLLLEKKDSVFLREDYTYALHVAVQATPD